MVGTRPQKVQSDTTLGLLLKTARQQQNVSLVTIAQDLNIPVKQLHALEEGNLGVFAAEVYARGAFVKYATYLGVETRTVEHAFLRGLKDVREFVPLRVHRPHAWLSRLRNPRWILAGILGSCALVVGIYIGVQVHSFWRLPALAILEPVSPVLRETAVVVRGRAEAEAQVFVNTEPVLLDANQAFTLSLLLHPGINVLQVEAKGASGRTRVITQHLLVTGG